MFEKFVNQVGGYDQMAYDWIVPLALIIIILGVVTSVVIVIKKKKADSSKQSSDKKHVKKEKFTKRDSDENTD